MGNNKGLVAMDAATGEERRRLSPGGVVWANPAVAEGMAVSGFSGWYLIAVDADTGQERWRPRTRGETYRGSAATDGTVYAGSVDGRQWAVDAATGEERRRLQTGGEVYSTPVVADGTVYVGSLDNFPVRDSHLTPVRTCDLPLCESPVEGGQLTFCCTYGVSRTGPTRP
ncbi:PQQ-binding-like beta-propeller repeat protein [Streptomyces sp. MBT65]|nr:PQQ-binding-like beta-propeller repeat protein [Streptomyces sp. MBT65]